MKKHATRKSTTAIAIVCCISCSEAVYVTVFRCDLGLFPSSPSSLSCGSGHFQRTNHGISQTYTPRQLTIQNSWRLMCDSVIFLLVIVHWLLFQCFILNEFDKFRLCFQFFHGFFCKFQQYTSAKNTNMSTANQI